MTRSTQQVMDDHIAAVEAGDLPKIVADYADDAIVITPDGALVGTEAIGAAFGQLLAGFPNLKFADATTLIEGDTVLLCWTAESDTASLTDGVDTFIVQDDRIQRQTARFTVVPKQA